MQTAERDSQGFTENTDVASNFKNFLCNILVHTKKNCEYAAKHFTSLQAVKEAFNKNHGSQDAKCWAYAWNWTFGDTLCELSLREVCDTLGLEEYAIRRRIMADCPPNVDISRYARHALDYAVRLDSYTKRRAKQEIEVPWDALAEYRKLYPRGEVPLQEYLDGKKNQEPEGDVEVQQAEAYAFAPEEIPCSQSLFEWYRETDSLWTAGREWESEKEWGEFIRKKEESLVQGEAQEEYQEGGT